MKALHWRDRTSTYPLGYENSVFTVGKLFPSVTYFYFPSTSTTNSLRFWHHRDSLLVTTTLQFLLLWRLRPRNRTFENTHTVQYIISQWASFIPFCSTSRSHILSWHTCSSLEMKSLNEMSGKVKYRHFPFHPKFRKFRLVHQMEQIISVCSVWNIRDQL